MIKRIYQKRSILISLTFIFFGLYFFIISKQGMHHHNDNLLFGLNEMTWMWLVMGFSHIFFKSCDCKK